MDMTWTFNGGFAFWKLDGAVAAALVEPLPVAQTTAPIPFVVRQGKDSVTGRILWASACSESETQDSRADGQVVTLTQGGAQSRAICLPPRALAA
jgi:hypothetical protein